MNSLRRFGIAPLVFAALAAGTAQGENQTSADELNLTPNQAETISDEELAEERGRLMINIPAFPMLDLDNPQLNSRSRDVSADIPNVGDRYRSGSFASALQVLHDRVGLISERGQGEQFGGNTGLSNEMQSTDLISQCPTNCPLDQVSGGGN